jgi:ABC-2 type transport system permease protein
LRQIIKLFYKQCIVFRNDKVAVALTFIVPLVLMSIFGSIFGGAGTDAQGIPIAFLNESSSPLAMQIEKTLDTMKTFFVIKSYKNDRGEVTKFDTTSIKEFVRNGHADAALVLPADMYSDTSFGLKVKYYYDPKNEIENQINQGVLHQLMFRQVPKIFDEASRRGVEKFLGREKGNEFYDKMTSLTSSYFRHDKPAGHPPDSSAAADNPGLSNFMQNIVRFENVQLVGNDIKNPGATRSVGGWAMTFLLFTLTAAASSLFEEKKNGVMLRFLTSPVTRVQILWSKYLFTMGLGIVQLLFLFTSGWVLFHIDIFPNFFNLLLIIISASMACTAFGMLLASFSSTRQQAQGWGTLLILTMSSVGGAWFPTSMMPPLFQTISKLTVVYWSMGGFMEVPWRGSGFVAILPYVGVLVGMSAIINVVSVLQFRKGKVLEA